MQPPSIKEVTSLVDRWFEIANRDTSSTDERIALYEDTEKVANFLDEAGKGKTAPVKERIAGLTEQLIKAMNKHQVGEATLLASWVARHTRYKPGSSKETEEGAYSSLHHLFSSILFSTRQDIDSPDMLQFSFIDAASLVYVNMTTSRSPKKDLPKEMAKTERALLAKMSSKLGALRATSKAHKEIADLELINRLNNKGLN